MTNAERLEEIRFTLRDICEKEAYNLFRLARNAQKRGVNAEIVCDIKEEASELLRISFSYPETVLEFKYRWSHKYAFNYKGSKHNR